MIEITPRMRSSKRLQSYISEHKRIELEAIRDYLVESERAGAIGHGGSDGQYTFDVRGIELRVGTMIAKCEFNEGEEVIEYLRSCLNSYWTNILDKFAKAYSAETLNVLNAWEVPACTEFPTPKSRI